MNDPSSSSSAESQQSPNEHQSASSGTSRLIRLCAIGLFASFFLTWTPFIGQNLSGFDLQKLGGHQKWLWLIPGFSVITIFLPVTGRYQKLVALLTGVLPFCVLSYWFSQLGGDLLRMLGVGAWLSLLFGLALLILPIVSHRTP